MRKRDAWMGGGTNKEIDFGFLEGYRELSKYQKDERLMCSRENEHIVRKLIWFDIETNIKSRLTLSLSCSSLEAKYIPFSILSYILSNTKTPLLRPLITGLDGKYTGGSQAI